MADIIGTNADDYLSGTDCDDQIDSLSGNDIINGSGGNDIIDGGQGSFNQIDYDGWLGDYSFARDDNGSILVTKPNGGVDTLSNIGGLWFCQEDRWVAIDDLPYDNDQNDAPVTSDDWADITAGEPSVIDVLANDCDPNGDALQITAINGIKMQPGWSTWVESIGLITVNADGTLTVDSPYPGNYCFEYTVSDGNGGTSTASVEGVSNPPVPVNSDPDAQNDRVDGTVGTISTFSPLENDSDADGDALTITAINGTPMQPGWSTWVDNVGLVTVNADGTLSLDSQFVGDFCFEYTISDGNGGTATATIEGTNTPAANQGPEAVHDIISGDAGDVLTVSPLDNDSDPDGDALTITEIDGTAMQAGWQTWVEGVGLVTLNADNTLTIEPIPGLTSVNFNYTISDGNGGTSIGEICGTVEEGVINSVSAEADAATTEHETPVTINVLANDTDADGDAFSVTGFGNGANGTVSQGQNGQLIYTPNAGFSGTDTFTYTITDAQGAVDTATVTVDVQEQVIPNTTDAVDDASSTEFDTPVSIDVLGNDRDAEGDAFSVTGFGNGANGTVSQGQNGQLIYTPNAGFSGSDTFTYTITDANGAVDTATVTVDVQEQVIPNTTDAVDDASSTEFDTPVSIDVLGNDQDTEGDAFSVTGFGNGANGTVSQGQNGQLIYTPNAGFSGTDTFTYTITDANGAVDTATVTVDVQEQVIPNTTDAVDDASSTEFDTPVSIDVLGNDQDAEGDAFSVTGFGNGANGTVSQGQNGQLIYTPNAGFSGTDTFTYTITDANGAVDTATVCVEVEPPVATAAIGDRVWLDTNDNGLQDDGEAGIAGVTVNLKDASGTIIDSQQTDANGNYWFETLVAGDYYIGVVAPEGYNFTTQDVGNNNHGTDSDVNVDSGMTDAIHLKEGQIVASADAGLVSNATASVGDRIWHDANGNGVQDNGEAGAADITVQLKDADGTIIQSQQTDGNGNYLFENVAAGQYSVGVIAPDGYGFTEQDAVGSRSHNDSDVDVDTGMTDTFDVKEGAALTNVDAGLIDTSTQTGGDNITTCEDETSTFNVLDNDQGNGLRLVNVTHETPELQAEFEARGGALTFDADGNVTYTGMGDYYGNDVLIYTLENAHGQSFTDRVEMTIEAVSDASVLDVTEDFQRGRAGNREDTSYQKHITHHSTAERIVYTQFFEPFVNDDKDGLQEFGDYNIGVADDRDNIAFIELFDAQDNGTVWKLGSEVIDPVNETVRIPWNKIVFGSLKVDVAGIGTEHKFNFRVVDTGGDVSDQKGANISNGDFVKLWTPIALDLNGDDKIGVTGETSSHQKDADAEIGRTVEFDIDADGDKDTIEWFDGSGDGILVDTSKIGADGSIDGSALFGDEGGKYANGYEKLEAFDTNGDGQISGDELDTIGLWVDDGDAILEEGELKTTNEAGIASVSTQMEIVLDGDGKELMQSSATTLDGEVILTEDVWFAEDPLTAMDEAGLPDVEVCEDCFG